jgi:hypothetical protein
MSRPRKYSEELFERGIRLALESGRPDRARRRAIAERIALLSRRSGQRPHSTVDAIFDCQCRIAKPIVCVAMDVVAEPPPDDLLRK